MIDNRIIQQIIAWEARQAGETVRREPAVNYLARPQDLSRRRRGFSARFGAFWKERKPAPATYAALECCGETQRG